MMHEWTIEDDVDAFFEGVVQYFVYFVVYWNMSVLVKIMWKITESVFTDIYVRSNIIWKQLSMYMLSTIFVKIIVMPLCVW